MNLADTIAILKKARELLSSPTSWTKGRFARNKSGAGVGYDSQEACQFCTRGALARARDDLGFVGNFTYEEPVSLLEDALRKILPSGRLSPGGVTEYNDAASTTHDKIVALFDKAIEIGERRMRR